jgi:phospholipase C
VADNNHNNFDFTQLGIRVPAVVISPLIPANLIDHRVYDHSSLLATVEDLFGLPTLTERQRLPPKRKSIRARKVAAQRARAG